MVPIATTMAVSNYVFFYSLQLIRGLLASREGGPVRHRGARGGSRARSLLASSLAGIVNVIITNPLWVANLRIVQQRRSSDDGGDDGTGDDDDAREEPGLLTMMGRIGREEGVPGLWSGTLASLILVANPVLQFFAYEQVRLSLLGRRRRLERGGKPASLSPPEAFAVGAAAKTLATVVTYPVQLAQTLLRLPGEGGGDAGTLSCLARLYGEGGGCRMVLGHEGQASADSRHGVLHVSVLRTDPGVHDWPGGGPGWGGWAVGEVPIHT